MGREEDNSIRQRRRLSRDLTLLAAILLAVSLLLGQSAWATPGEAKSATASGNVIIDGKSIKLNYAYAMAQPNTFDKQKTDIAVLLTEKPVPEKAFKDVEDLRKVSRDLSNWIYFKIDEKQKTISEVADHPSLGEEKIQMSGVTNSAFVTKKLSRDRIEGIFKTRVAEKVLGHSYNVDVTFGAPILQAKLPEPLPNAKTGKVLPPGGGEPGKAYLLFVNAVERGDIGTVKKLAPSPNEGRQFTDEQIKGMLEFMAAMTPKDLKITKGFAEGDRAVLYVKGILEKKETYGTIEMIRKGGEWRVKKESWSDTPPDKCKGSNVVGKRLSRGPIPGNSYKNTYFALLA